ncbi:uncharacterized protein LOC121406562 [Lytechinus variegatus]|uniref:uncharacterized protein LOC121406562 n=1 Tax=Lytechinus variegatus TaxID=7654 RepID=UPI001BB1E7D7|nr:uncharacterized protein LOC121406562 [Lytechinus variegatus]
MEFPTISPILEISMGLKEQSLYEPITRPTKLQSKEKTCKRVSNTNDESVTCKETRFKKKHVNLNRHSPTINTTSSIFIHNGNNIPSYISDCPWLQECYYTSLGVCQSGTRECETSDFESDLDQNHEDDELTKPRVNDILINIASMVLLPSEKTKNDGKVRIVKHNSCPPSPAITSTKERDRCQAQHGNVGRHFLSDHVHPQDMKMSKLSCTPQPTQLLVLPQIDAKRNFHPRTPRESTSKKKKAWGSAESPVKNLQPQFREGANISEVQSTPKNQFKSGLMRSTRELIAGKNVSSNETGFVKRATKKNTSLPRSLPSFREYSVNKRDKHNVRYSSDSKLAAIKTQCTEDQTMMNGSILMSSSNLRKTYASRAERLEYSPLTSLNTDVDLARCVSTPTIRLPSGPCPERRLQGMTLNAHRVNRNSPP